MLFRSISLRKLPLPICLQCGKGYSSRLRQLSIILTSLFFSSILFKALPGTLQERRTGIAMASFGNSGMIPLTITELLPLSLPLFAEKIGVGEASLFVGAYILAEVPIIWSLGSFLITGEGRLPKIKELITPPLIGVAAGIFIVISGLQPVLFSSRLPFFYIMESFSRFGAVTFSLILLHTRINGRPNEDRSRPGTRSATTNSSLLLSSDFLSCRHFFSCVSGFLRVTFS